MKLSHRWNVSRILVVAFIGLFVGPISAISPEEATLRNGTIAASTDSPPPDRQMQTFSAAIVTAEQPTQLALLDRSMAGDLGNVFLPRLALAAVVRPAPPEQVEEMGLKLPEPGPLSAIIATIAMAGVVLIRRAG